jgi:hypothetical protein
VHPIRWLKSNVDAFDVWFGLLPWLTGFAMAVSWAKLIVRALRGEAVKEDWRVTYSTAAFIAVRAMADASGPRESAALRDSVTEMRGLLRDAAQDAEERDKRAATRDRRLYRTTVAMAVLAGFTLLAAIGSVIVAFIHA